MSARLLPALGAGLVSVGLAGCGGGLASPRPYLLDLEGHEAHPFQAAGAKADVFVFVRTDCPVSNRYAPEVGRLCDEFAARGIGFWLVYPDPKEPVETIRAHVREYAYPGIVLRDPRHDLVRMTGVRVTPEAAVFVRHGSGAKMVYRGRIDDRYVDFGTMRPEPTTRDLERTLEAVLGGRRLDAKTTLAVGCFIPELRGP